MSSRRKGGKGDEGAHPFPVNFMEEQDFQQRLAPDPQHRDEREQGSGRNENARNRLSFVLS